MKRWWTGVAGLLLLSVRIGIPSAPAAPAQPQGPFVSGTIASARSGQPIPGAKVEIFEQLDADASRELRAAGDLVGEPLARGAADSSGRFHLAAPPGKRIVVVAQAPGHARSRFGRPLVLPPGSAQRDLGELELPEGRRLSGKVVDSAGAPVAGARVIGLVSPRRAQRGGTGAGLARALATGNVATSFPVTAETGADGTFMLDSAPLRSLSLRVYAKGMAPGWEANVPARAGFTMRLSSGHPLAGKVAAPDGKSPVAGAWVMAGDEGLDGITRTDGKGAFRFEHLRAGTVQITASAPSSVIVPEDEAPSKAKGPDALLADARSTYAPSAPARVTLPVPIDPNAPAQARAPLLRLRPGGIINARAIDSETRLPLAGASLVLNAPGEPMPRFAITAGPGVAIFAGVPAGNVDLRGEADGYLEEEEGPAPLASGQTRAIGVALRPAAALEGTVRDATGRPISGATVSVAGPPPIPIAVPIPIFFPVGVDPVESDAQGRFLLERLPPKVDIKISVESPAFAPWEMPGIRLRPGERRSGMEVLLDAGLMITGRVLDPERKPVGGASVTASRKREGGPGGFVIRIDAGRGSKAGGRGGPVRSGMGGDEYPPVQTDPDGVFRVRGARPGIWSLEVKAHGYAPGSVGGLKLEESASSLDAGDIALQPGAAIRGRAVTGAGDPVPFARGFARKEFSPVGEFTTAEDGSFVIGDLTAGEPLTVSIDADGFSAVEKAGLVAPLDDLEITLTAASRVSGRVLDRETRRPIGDFAISMSRSRGAGGGAMRMAMAIEGPETTFHTEDGTFTIEDADPGKATVTARAPGYRDFTMRDLEIPTGRDMADLEFTLERSASVSGTVSDDRGRPLPGVEVRKKEASGGMGFTMRGMTGDDGATTDGDGNFLLAGLERGLMTLSFAHPEFEAADHDVDTSRDIEGLRVSLSRGATLSGVVLREADGSPVPGATVAATAAGSDRFGGARPATTGPDGAFLLESIGAGRYSLRAEAPGLRPALLDDLVVSAGASPPPIELRLGGGVTLSGTITGVKESELSRFTVRAMSGGMGGFGTTAAVDATGRFEMKGLAAGTLTLLAGSGMFGGKSATRTVAIPEGTATFETTIEFPRGSRVEGIVTRGGQPVEGATVIFMDAATRATVTATTDTSGHYTAEDLDDGEYNVSVLQFTAGLSHSTRASVKGDKQLDIEVPLAKIAGFVTDASTGHPLDDATITIKREGAAPASAGAGFMFRQEAATDATGYYEIEGLDDGTWTLTARRQGYGFLSRSVTLGPGISPGEISFDLARVDAFALRAIDAVTGLPPRSLGALVLSGGGDPLAPSGSGATAVYQGRLSADATGVFRLDSLQPGRYRVVLGGQGYGTETLHDVVVPGPEISISMGPGGSIEAASTSLKPGETARAVLLDSKGRPVHLNTFLAEPTFLLRPGVPTPLGDVKPGAYRLRASMSAGGIAEKPVVVVAGETVKVSIP
ncbi:MAG TPA: carboxypeptidase-like regulatory domain-containing protein [Candidatus Polarisedimenticolia bacterium]|jgi:protocatechuate 3,4-dioxygenase beta subunit